MTQKDKKLLLKDLCARLPYGITIYRITDNSIHHIQYSDITENIDQFSHFLEYSGVDNIKPYLRPMSSMTEEETKEYAEIWANREPYMPGETVDFFNAHHLDYRGLIPIGLALEATENMYQI